MNGPPEREELQRLISALLDERLSPEEHLRLEQLLAADPQARLLYMQMVDQEIELPCLVATVRDTDEAPAQLPAQGSLLRRSGTTITFWRRWAFGVACALVGIVVFAVVGSRVWFGNPPPPTQIAPVLSVRESWAEDFESGASAGWHGRLVTTNLPSGSQYGIAAIVKEYPAGAPSYVIQLPEEWNRGLVALTTGSTLNVTYRLGNRTHVNVFMHTISPEAGERKVEMYQLRSGGFPGRSGRWQTASIPFSSFVRKIVVEPGSSPTFVGGPPRVGEPITTLSFSSMDPSDLVIDRVWIAPTGPAREEIVPLRN
jgi:hypothetical protein